MPPYAYALASALLWALAVPILNRGLGRLPVASFAAVVPGLLVSMSAGTLALAAFALPLDGLRAVTLATVLAGVFTYPLATGLYYMAGFAFGTRTEFAAQFAKIKPLFSALIALLVLGETVSSQQALPLALMVGGIVLFYLGLPRRRATRMAVGLGLLTALSWAVGEAFVKMGFDGSNSLDQAFVALAVGTLLAWALYLPARAAGLRAVPWRADWLWPFALHGVISFGLAYTLFFHSIATLGLYRTVVINAFWPFLSILVVKAVQQAVGRRSAQPVPLTVWLASLLLLLASLVEITLQHRAA